MSWDWGVCHSPLHSSSETHRLDTHAEDGSHSVYSNLCSHTVQSIHLVITRQHSLMHGWKPSGTVTWIDSSSKFETLPSTNINQGDLNSDLPVSCKFWMQLRLPLCCAPPNTHRLWGQLSGTKLQCSYRESKPSHSGMSHSWLSGRERKDQEPQRKPFDVNVKWL